MVPEVDPHMGKRAPQGIEEDQVPGLKLILFTLRPSWLISEALRGSAVPIC